MMKIEIPIPFLNFNKIKYRECIQDNKKNTIPSKNINWIK